MTTIIENEPPITGVVLPPANPWDIGMHFAIKVAFYDALKSSDYAQNVIGRLRTIGDTFCPLGVLCDLAAKDKSTIAAWERAGTADHYVMLGQHASLPQMVREWAGIRGTHPSQDFVLWWANDWHPVYRLNDHFKMPFPIIADLVRAQY